MKVLVAHFTSECNEHITHTVGLDEFNLLYGDDCVKAMHIKEVFDKHKIDVVPAIFAGLHPNGMIKKEAFDYVAKTILDTIRDNLKDLDGIYLQFHGASGILDLDCVSGEHYLAKEIRKITGKYIPIAMCMDPHGNVTKELCNEINIIRCYRQSPHSDQIETEILVAEKLCNLMENRRPMHPIIKKLPIMVGGERSVSANEPMLSINKMMDELEKDSRIFSISYHVGYIRHDDDKLGAAVIVVPNNIEDIAYCNEMAEKVANYAWNHRNEFQFSGNYDEYEEAVKKAIEYNDKTVVITDSGDNCGAGGAGQNTQILREFIKVNPNKKVLVAGINDKVAHNFLVDKNENDKVEFDLGANEDELSKSIHVKGIITHVGQQKYGLGSGYVVGKAITVLIDGTNIEVIVLDHNIQYGTMDQFEVAGLDFHSYDIVVVKMGYLDTYLIPETKYHIMALTDGPTIQRSERIPFKKIYRPMWPIDDMEKLEYIEG